MSSSEKAGVGSSFAQLYLPAMGLAEFDLLRFAAGEVAWAAVTFGAICGVTYLFKSLSGRPKPEA